jgi:hypothetical protein
MTNENLEERATVSGEWKNQTIGEKALGIGSALGLGQAVGERATGQFWLYVLEQNGIEFLGDKAEYVAMASVAVPLALGMLGAWRYVNGNKRENQSY